MKNATRMGSLTAALLFACAAGNAMVASTPATASPAQAKSAPAQATPAKETPAKDTPAQPAPATDDALDNANTGPISEAEYMTRAEMSFNKRDVNADGYLSRSPCSRKPPSNRSWPWTRTATGASARPNTWPTC